MLFEFLKQIKTGLIVFAILTILTGIIYPLIVTDIALLLFGWRANGSLVVNEGQIVGSELIGQSFTDPKYFWGRPSATTPVAYNAVASSGSNLGPLNPKLLTAVKDRAATLKNADPQNELPIPVDLVTTSGSGLDPHISPAAAFYQVSRVARVRNLNPQVVHDLVEQHIERRPFFILGEPRVNVLRLNLALDALQQQKTSHD
jgi:K+-transporting ATPase ATPase C chain